MDSSSPKVPPVTNPGVDVAELLRYLMGDTGELQESMGGFRIKVFHTKAFPWDEVFKTLLYRDFRVYVTRHKADILIDASV
jgi:hypothetical protein